MVLVLVGLAKTLPWLLLSHCFSLIWHIKIKMFSFRFSKVFPKFFRFFLEVLVKHVEINHGISHAFATRIRVIQTIEINCCVTLRHAT